MEHLDIAVKLIRQYKIDLATLQKHIIKDTPLALALAKSYMQDVKLDRYNPKTDPSTVAENFANQSTLHASYPQYYLLKYIHHNQFDQAYEIYKAVPNKTIFDKKAIRKNL